MNLIPILFLQEAVSQACQEGVCIAIDALDEMQDEQRAHELSWLPKEVPQHIKVR